MDHEKSKLEEIEDSAILMINFAQSIQEVTDKRLKENFISRAYIENTNDQSYESWQEEFDSEKV